MENKLDDFYLSKEKSISSCLITLKEIILLYDNEIEASLKYGMPFFSYKGKMFCYLWVHKKYKMPYIGIVEGKRITHPQLISEKRSRMKIMLFNPSIDLPIDTIKSILKQAIDLYKIG